MKPLTMLRVIFTEKTGFSQNTNLQRSLVALVIFFIAVFILTFSVMPHRVSLEVGKPSPQTITAQREVVDFYNTSLLKDEAAAAIPETFDFDPGTLLLAEEGVSSFFAQVLDLQEIDDEAEKKARADAFFSGLPYELPENAAEALLNAGPKDVQELQAAVVMILQDALEQGIKPTGLESAHRQVMAEVNRQGFPQELLAGAEVLVLHFVNPNLIYNHEVTEKAREEARQAVEPVRILKGALIVTEGEQVTDAHIGQLEALGLQRQGADYAILVGLCIMMLIIFVVIGIYILLYENDIYQKPSLLFLYGLIIVLTLLFSVAGNFFSGFLIPVAMGIMLIAVLFNHRLALLTTIVFGLIIGLVTGGDFRFILIALMGGLVAIYGVYKVNRRDDLAKAGLYVSALNAVAIVGIFLFTGAVRLEYDFLRDFSVGILAGVGNGIFSAVMAIGLLPYLETGFGLTTSVTLLELANPNQKLLKRLLREAPGTYHHSIIVANLAEAAAESVGADPLLARVGAYYHDIGKLKRPYFFCENQIAQTNPHERISANLSKLIITSHTKDGAEIGRKDKLPQVILDIIQQHHGTSLMTFFYMRAAENSTDRDKVEESSFRYEGPRPHSKEAAIVMLADSVEAAVRSMVKPSAGKVEGMVRKIAKEKLNDGQLDESNLTLGEVDCIVDTFIHILSGIFHTRIEYPEKELKEIAGRDVNGSKNSL